MVVGLVWGCGVIECVDYFVVGAVEDVGGIDE